MLEILVYRKSKTFLSACSIIHSNLNGNVAWLMIFPMSYPTFKSLFLRQTPTPTHLYSVPGVTSFFFSSAPLFSCLSSKAWPRFKILPSFFKISPSFRFFLFTSPSVAVWLNLDVKSCYLLYVLLFSTMFFSDSFLYALISVSLPSLLLPLSPPRLFGVFWCEIAVTRATHTHTHTVTDWR